MSKLKYLIFGALILAFLKLATEAHEDAYFHIDVSTTLFVQSFKSPIIHSLMNFVSFFGYLNLANIILLIGLIVFLVIKNLRREGIMLLFSGFGADLAGQIIKRVVMRHRPDPSLITQIAHYTHSDSFPSGHVVFYTGFFGFLFYLSFKLVKNKWIKYLLCIICSFFIVLIGISRIYLGAHWLSDVIGAYLLGFIWLYVSIYLYERTRNEK